MRPVFLLAFLSLLDTCVRAQLQAFTPDRATAYAEEMWATLPQRLARIQPPTFPERDFIVKKNTQAGVQEAIEKCAAAGGGRVILPAGHYHSKGPLHLRSNVNLHLEAGAELTFSQDHLDYTPLVKVRWEGTVAYNFSPFIYANGQENIAITGAGTIDGGAEKWSRDWREKQKPDKNRLRQMGNDRTPENQRVFGHGFLDLDGDGKDDGYGTGRLHYLRPTLIELYECRNILIEGVTLRGSCFWTTHPVFSQNVTIRNLRVYGGYLNDDGIDPDSCTDVLIEGCYVETEDDAISIKAGRDQDAWNRPGSRNIIVRDCALASGVNAFCVGSEMSGGVHEVFAEDCRLLRGKHALNFKSNLDRGGEVSDVFIRNITADTLDEALFIFRMDYHGYRGGNFPTRFRDFYVQNVRADYVQAGAFKVVGVPAAPIERVLLENVRTNAEWVGEGAHCRQVFLRGVAVNGQAVKALGRSTQVPGEGPGSGQYLITDYGAVGDGMTLNTTAIQEVLDRVARAGGGQVIVPPGNFLTGTLRLPSDLQLVLLTGARLLGSTNLADYDPENPHLLYASDAENISLSGAGTIDGQGEHFFDKAGHTGEATVRSWRALERPQPWLVFDRCTRLRIRDLRLVNAPAHVLAFNESREIVVDGIEIRNDPRSPNTDGIDIRDSRDVRITNCRIDTGDDAICLKSKRDTVENVLVTNCHLSSDDAGIKFGTGTAMCIRDCRFSNLVIDRTRYGIALFMLDGGVNEHCIFDNITISNGSRHATEYPIFVDIDKRYPDRALGTQRFLTFSNLDIFTRNKLLLAGQPGVPLQNVTLRDLRIHVAEDCRDLAQIERKPKGNKSLVPEPGLVDYATRPGTVTLGHIEGLLLENVRVFSACGRTREDFWQIDVKE
ncbi:MAG: glycosyl hydrolase family 28 protein [Bacteroidota bacterium]